MLSTDKIDLKLDIVTHDLDLTGGRLNLSNGVAGVAQAALVAVQQIKGEWLFNQQSGVPYVVFPGVVTASEALLGSKFAAARVESALRTVLAGIEGVTQVLILRTSIDNRSRKVSSRIQLRTQFGDTVLLRVDH